MLLKISTGHIIITYTHYFITYLSTSMPVMNYNSSIIICLPTIIKKNIYATLLLLSLLTQNEVPLSQEFNVHLKNIITL
jgi:hypothetical protein